MLLSADPAMALPMEQADLLVKVQPSPQLGSLSA